MNKGLQSFNLISSQVLLFIPTFSSPDSKLLSLSPLFSFPHFPKCQLLLPWPLLLSQLFPFISSSPVPPTPLFPSVLSVFSPTAFFPLSSGCLSTVEECLRSPGWCLSNAHVWGCLWYDELKHCRSNSWPVTPLSSPPATATNRDVSYPSVCLNPPFKWNSAYMFFWKVNPWKTFKITTNQHPCISFQSIGNKK